MRLMKKVLIGAIVIFFSVVSCTNNLFNNRVEIPDFDYPETVVFEDNLSAYNIYQGTPSDLIPSDDFHLLELNSVLFTDYAYKQRLVKVPEGTKMARLSDDSIDFPDGSILIKTFFYYDDERDFTLGKRIIETRLLIKESNTWNVATYIWNEDQSEATLELEGSDTQINWVNSKGDNLSTLYHIPNKNECIACHQSDATMIPLGTTMRNLNRLVDRNGSSLNQINHLQFVGFLYEFDVNGISEIVDYKDASYSTKDRARAYLDLNCAHCHQPSAWDESASEDFDFRYETALSQTGISNEINNIRRQLNRREMPFIGTTILDQEGVDLVIEYIESL